MTKKKILKFIALIFAVVLILFLIYIANGLVGNPISKYLAVKSAEKYVAQTYRDTDFILGEVTHDFKTGGYYARVTSPSSEDTHFSFELDQLGEVKHDYYESRVLSGWNTWERLNTSYQELVDTVFSSSDFPYESEIDYGMIERYDDSQKEIGINMSSLELDQEFDLTQIGKAYGEIVFYAQSEEISVEKASEVLLDITRILDENSVYFKQIDFVLQKPWVEGQANLDRSQVSIEDFLYTDIYEEGLEQRVQKAHDYITLYYQEVDEEFANYTPESIDT